MKRLNEFSQPRAIRSAGDVKMPFLDNSTLSKSDVQKRLQIAEDLGFCGRPSQDIETYKAGLLSSFFFGP